MTTVELIFFLLMVDIHVRYIPQDMSNRTREDDNPENAFQVTVRSNDCICESENLCMLLKS